jgi:predicted ribosomally synthesized peptide with nif11-like leader
VISSSSDELKKFLGLLAGDTVFQQQLNQPGCDPVLLAAERGIIIEQCEFDRLASALQDHPQIELSDEELEQVAGGFFVEAFIAPVIVSINISVGIVAVAGAAAIGAGAYAIYKASE